MCDKKTRVMRVFLYDIINVNDIEDKVKYKVKGCNERRYFDGVL